MSIKFVSGGLPCLDEWNLRPEKPLDVIDKIARGGAEELLRCLRNSPNDYFYFRFPLLWWPEAKTNPLALSFGIEGTGKNGDLEFSVDIQQIILAQVRESSRELDMHKPMQQFARALVDLAGKIPGIIEKTRKEVELKRSLDERIAAVRGTLKYTELGERLGKKSGSPLIDLLSAKDKEIIEACHLDLDAHLFCATDDELYSIVKLSKKSVKGIRKLTGDVYAKRAEQ